MTTEVKNRVKRLSGHFQIKLDQKDCDSNNIDATRPGVVNNDLTILDPDRNNLYQNYAIIPERLDFIPEKLHKIETLLQK